MRRNPEVRIVRAARKDLDDLVPLFDGYRQFYAQRSDPVAAARSSASGWSATSP